MASFQFPDHLLTFLCFSLIVVSTAGTHRSLEVGVYSNQNINQNSLLDACNSGNYQLINIVFDVSLGNAQTPEINLISHCNSTASDDCTKFTQEIKSCQALGIRIMLSIGGGAGKYNLHNFTEATNFSIYLWNNFLGGQSNSRPLTDVVFDGVDITNDRSSWDNWSKLGEELRKLYEKQGNKFYLSAAPQCSSLDSSSHLIPQPVIFDYISVQFFGDNLICQYVNGRFEGFWKFWNDWKTFSAGKVFVKMLAAPMAEDMGYIPPDVFRTQVLPELQRSSKFGGVILWSEDLDKGYSSEINPKACGSVGAELQTANEMAEFPMSNNYDGRRGFRSCRGSCVL
ncbi:acidic endochitinase-like [Benincasa hispida]|uniref:acidic endochitinase-like n=1 Tax=Benincasa hispida TaxID=102211 RepID=UPI0019019C36|nr:acidic endochitinase-like [Benincasa hispida]